MPEAGRQSRQSHGGLTDDGAAGIQRKQLPVVPGDVAGIFHSLSELYHVLIECLEDSAEGPADPQTVLRVLREQKRLIYSMEEATDAATASGIPPHEIGAVVGRIDKLHRYCGQLMRRHANDLEHTIAALQAQQTQCGAYKAQQRRAG